MMRVLLLTFLIVSTAAGASVERRGLSSADCVRCPNFVNQVGYLVDPDDCSAFYQCQKSGDDSYTIKRVCCQDNLYWSQDKLTCVREQLTKGCRLCPPRECEATAPAPGPCSLLPSQDPRKFIQLVGGTGVLQNCPAGLVFSPPACRCDWPKEPVEPPETECDSDAVLYFPFEEDVHDHSCTRAHSTDVGGVKIVHQKSGAPAAYFSGENKLEVPYMTNWFNDKRVNKFSVAVWVYNEGIGGSSGLQGLVGNGDCDQRGSVEVGLGSTDRLLYTLVTSAERHVDTSTGFKVEEGRWQHVAVVYDGQTVQPYLDGQPSSAPRPTAGYISNRQCPLSIGHTGQKEGLGYFHGYLDELRLYQRALSSEEIAKLAKQR